MRQSKITVAITQEASGPQCSGPISATDPGMEDYIFTDCKISRATSNDFGNLYMAAPMISMA
jgi:hypothetical protein